MPACMAAPESTCDLPDAYAPASQSDPAAFDADWYIGQYPDVALSGLSPHEHYVQFGRFLNRQPGPHGTLAQSIPDSAFAHALPVSSPSADARLPSPQRRSHNSALLRGGFNLPGKEVPLVRGWLAVIGDTQPRSAIVQIGTTHRLEARCDGFRTDLLENKVNEGKHGFELLLPIELIDGKPRPLKLIDKATGKVLAEESAAWVQERSFNDFSGFLGHSLVSPLIYSPFREEDKRCFAVMENIADYLVQLAENLTPAPLVSVIMPVHNRLSTVGEAIESVLEQSYRNVELILIDDGSTDGTHDVLSELAEKDKRLVLLQNESCRGVSFSRNRGLAQAKGELICYLDSDNTWDRRYIAATVGAFRHLPDAQAIYGGQALFRGTTSCPFAIRFGSLNKGLLENRNYIDLNAFAHTRAALGASGSFDESLARFVDWDFILRMSESARMVSVPVLLCNYYFDKAENTLTNAAHLFGQLEHVRANMHRRKEEANRIGTRQEKAETRGRRKERVRNVSVIIPSYEALSDLTECIESIHDLRTELTVQIIVIDNASGDPVRRYLDDLAARNHIRYLRNPCNYGFTRAVNQGLALAGPQDDVLLLNNDATLTQGALDALHEAAYQLPQCGLTVPRQVLPGGTKTIADHVPYASPDQECDVNLSKHHSNVLSPPVFHHGEHTELSFAPFFCVYVKRKVLQLAPRLDEQHGRHYRSDRIYCDYVRNILGFRIYHVSGAVVNHKLQRSTDLLQSTAAQGKSDFDEICINNTWGEQLSRQFGYQSPVWERASIDRRPC
jgi:glycosyltransferase involved in cell wall biosynthesis